MILRPKSLRAMRALVTKAEELATDETNENQKYLRVYADGARAVFDILVAALNEGNKVKL